MGIRVRKIDLFEFFIHFSKIYYKKSIFLVFLIHEYHCMILVICYNINKKFKNAMTRQRSKKCQKKFIVNTAESQRQA